MAAIFSWKRAAVPAGRCRSNGRVGWSDEAQQAGIQSDELVDGRADKVGDQAQIGGVVDGDGVGEHGRVEGDVVEAVLGGVIGDDDGGEDFGDVVLGFAGKIVALVEFPEVGVAGLLDRALNIAGAPVVAGHGEIPVAELGVDVLHVASVGAGGFFGIEALVDIFVARQGRSCRGA